MRIAQVAPLYESVPPQAYGGTERVVSYLTEELVRQGHEVTLFASGDSRTSAKLVSPCSRSLRLDPVCHDRLSHHMILLDQVYERADDLDVIHFHLDYLHFPASRFSFRPRVTTLHGRLDIPDLIPLYDRFREEPLVSISSSQRRPLPLAHWRDTVYHGLPPDLLQFHSSPQEYLAFVGRISPEKRLDRAIAIARRTGRPLRIAAKIDPADQDYFAREIEPLLAAPGIEYVGEIGDGEKSVFIGNAAALLFPIDWPEPFGLVMIESLACGTPVIAWNCGSVPEVIDDGVTGFICQSVDEAVRAVPRVGGLSRLNCRRVFESRFTAERMAQDYVRIYEALIQAAETERAPSDGRNHHRPGSLLHPGHVVAN